MYMHTQSVYAETHTYTHIHTHTHTQQGNYLSTILPQNNMTYLIKIAYVPFNYAGIYFLRG